MTDRYISSATVSSLQKIMSYALDFLRNWILMMSRCAAVWRSVYCNSYELVDSRIRLSHHICCF